MMKKLLYLLVMGLLTGCLNSDAPDILSFEEQLAVDVNLIEDYLEENNITANIHSSGIRYVKTKNGSGQIPFENEDFVAKYKASLLNGKKIFESKYGSTFNLSTNLITAWQIMVQEMREGDEITMYAPSGYCFGTTQTTDIPANSIFRFDLELVRLINEEGEQLAADTVIIDEYLVDNDIDYLIHESSIRYSVDETGNGSSPELSDEIEVRYKGYFTTGEVFDESPNQPNGSSTFTLNGTIEAWKIMVPEMKEGGKMTIYAPSEFCYGSAGLGNILPNTILIFEIELVSIK